MPVYNQVILASDPEYLQPKSYDARADRRYFGDIMSPGVIAVPSTTTGDYAVTFVSGMNLSIAAGIAYILGQNISDQGMYRQYSSAAQTLTVPAASGANPRIDTVILRVMDTAADASGYSEGRIEIVPGTPTGGASLANLSGKANLASLGEASKSVLALAYILVPQGAASLTSTAVNVLDARVRTRVGGGNAQSNQPQVYDPTSFGLITPFDGMEAYLAVDVANGIKWHLRYYGGSASAYKWEFLGGADMYVEVTTNETVAAGGAYAALATAGPSITVPRAGDYDVEIGFLSTSWFGIMSYDIGATGAVDADSVIGNGTANTNGSRLRRKTGLGINTALVSRYKGTGSAAVGFSNRWMRVRPIRVS